jgi:hypothetical protein
MISKLARKVDNQEKRPLFLFLLLLIWLAINLLQSAFTELAHDEAYYWMYSRNLAWGYFDHPPFIAILIKLGYALIPEEIGVRLLPSLLGTLTIFVIYCLIDTPGKKLSLFILLIFPVILMHAHVAGFLAIPDIPVIFFSSLFLLTYKYYLEKDSYPLALLLSLIASLMLYSKYHGILLIFFTIFANVKIMKRASFWFIPGLTALMLLPHLFWQINNGYPTFVYHLFSRSSAYKPEHTINFLYSQILIAGPLVAVIILYQAFFYKPISVFDRVLKINLFGIFAFFFLSSFKGHVEAHWTAIAYIPMMVLAYKGAHKSEGAVKWLTFLFLPSLIIFFIIRILLAFNIISSNVSTLKEVHGWDKWTSQIDSLAQGRDVVFVNSFQRAAKYSFYSGGKIAHTLNNIYYRKNQYDIWPYEDSLQHKQVLLLHSRNASDSIMTAVGEQYKYKYFDDFKSYYNIKIIPDSTQLNSHAKDIRQLKVTLSNPRNDSIVFQTGDRIVIAFHNGKEFLRLLKVYNLDKDKISRHSTMNLTLYIPMPSDEGNYDMFISIATLYQYPALNSIPVKVHIK